MNRLEGMASQLQERVQKIEDDHVEARTLEQGGHALVALREEFERVQVRAVRAQRLAWLCWSRLVDLEKKIRAHHQLSRRRQQLVRDTLT
jgi:hypothetical protein